MTDPGPLSVLSLDQLRERTSVKWAHYPPDVLPLFVAEMDTPLAEPVERVLVNAARLGDVGYTLGGDYVEALDGFARRHWGWDGVTQQRTRVVLNTMNGVAAAIGALTEPGDRVVLNCPVYAPFYSYTEHAGRVVEEAPLGEDGRLDFGALEAAFERARAASRRPAYLLCSPHNPTGAVHTPEELSRIVSLAASYSVAVISDEIHAPLVLRGTFTPFLSRPGTEGAVAILSASKTFNLAGAPGAALVVGEAAGHVLTTLQQRVVPGPSHLGVLAQSAALREGDAWLAALLDDLVARQDLLVRLLAQHLPGARYQPGDATYLAWLDVSELGLPPSAENLEHRMDVVSGPARHFLEVARVALTDGAEFGTGGREHVRLNFATTEAILTEALERLGRSLP